VYTIIIIIIIITSLNATVNINKQKETISDIEHQQHNRWEMSTKQLIWSPENQS